MLLQKPLLLNIFVNFRRVTALFLLHFRLLPFCSVGFFHLILPFYLKNPVLCCPTFSLLIFHPVTILQFERDHTGGCKIPSNIYRSRKTKITFLSTVSIATISINQTCAIKSTDFRRDMIGELRG